MAPLSVIITCKGRLEHLRRTLPAAVEHLAGAEFILVDYDCPQHAGDWALANLPTVTVVRVKDRPHFSCAKSRNAGAARATAPWLLFMDADDLLTAPLLAEIQSRQASGVFLLPDPRPPILYGMVAVARADFEAVGRYDEIFEGWGCEDVEFLGRLEAHGLRPAKFDARSIIGIEHEDSARTQFHEVGLRALNWTVNGAYMAAKRDLTRLGLSMATTELQSLYGAFKGALANAAFDGRTVSHRVAFRREAFGALDVVTSLKYDIELRPQDTDPPA